MSRARLVARNASRGTVLAETTGRRLVLLGQVHGSDGRAPLPAGDGLWLPGENGIHMLFMSFAIDVVFVSPPTAGRVRPAARVLALHRAVPPWRGVVWRVGGAKGVLELPVGTIEATRHGRGRRDRRSRPA